MTVILKTLNGPDEVCEGVTDLDALLAQLPDDVVTAVTVRVPA
jgi:hypothetical protein